MLILAGAMALALPAAARPADDWILIVTGQENNQVRVVIAQWGLKTLEDCQSAAQIATQLSPANVIYGCQHVDQKFRFTTVRGRWE
jgi:hypothetical protein